MNFKEYYLLTEHKQIEKSYCLMVYPNEKSVQKINHIHKLLNVKAKENITPKKYHTTIRYFKTTNDIKPFIDFLKDFDFQTYTAHSTIVDFLGDSYSLMLESNELQKLFDKINSWLIKNNYPKSDYPKYKPHIAFCYEPHKSWIPTELDKSDYDIEIAYDNVKLSCDHETIWKFK